MPNTEVLKELDLLQGLQGLEMGRGKEGIWWLAGVKQRRRGRLLLTLEAVVYNEFFLGLVDSYSYKWGGQIVKTPIEV